MTIRQYPAGLGGILGDEIITATELYTSGSVRFVHHSGDNSNQGTHRQKPWASLVYALTQAGATDVIVLLDGHTETIATKQTIALSGLKIVAEGQSSGQPTVALSFSVSNDNGLNITGTNVALGNIRFPASTTLGTNAVVNVVGGRSMIRGCRFELEAGQIGVSWDDAATGPRIYNTTIVSVSTTSPPFIGLSLNAVTDAELEACTFDGGQTGFTDGGIDAGLAVRFRAQQMRLLNGADAFFDDDVTGYIGIAEKSGGSSITGFKRRLPVGFRQTGDAMLADVEFYMSGTPFYVHYGSGDDGNTGLDELTPKKTVASAISALTSNQDIVLLLPGHDEPLAAAITFPRDGVTLIGCGTSDGKPSCRFHKAVAAGGIPLCLMDFIAYVRNVWFDKGADNETLSTEMIGIAAAMAEMRGCLVRPGVSDVVGVLATNNLLTIRETKFESGGTLESPGVFERANRGLSFVSEGSMRDVDVRGCIFSNAETGFEQRAWVDQEPVTRLYVIAMTQLFGADVYIDPNTTGIVNPESSSGMAPVEW